MTPVIKDKNKTQVVCILTTVQNSPKQNLYFCSIRFTSGHLHLLQCIMNKKDDFYYSLHLILNKLACVEYPLCAMNIPKLQRIITYSSCSQGAHRLMGDPICMSKAAMHNAINSRTH